MSTTQHHPAVAVLVAEFEGYLLRRLPELLATFAQPATNTVETIAQRNARWLAVLDSLPDEHGRLARAARLIAKHDGVKEATARRTLSDAKAARQPRYGSPPKPDSPPGCWH